MGNVQPELGGSQRNPGLSLTAAREFPHLSGLSQLLRLHVLDSCSSHLGLPSFTHTPNGVHDHILLLLPSGSDHSLPWPLLPLSPLSHRRLSPGLLQDAQSVAPPRPLKNDTQTTSPSTASSSWLCFSLYHLYHLTLHTYIKL